MLSKQQLENVLVYIGHELRKEGHDFIFAVHVEGKKVFCGISLENNNQEILMKSIGMHLETLGAAETFDNPQEAFKSLIDAMNADRSAE